MLMSTAGSGNRKEDRLTVVNAAQVVIGYFFTMYYLFELICMMVADWSAELLKYVVAIGLPENGEIANRPM